jgi:hypothetical protein
MSFFSNLKAISKMAFSELDSLAQPALNRLPPVTEFEVDAELPILRNRRIRITANKWAGCPTARDMVQDYAEQAGAILDPLGEVSVSIHFTENEYRVYISMEGRDIPHIAESFPEFITSPRGASAEFALRITHRLCEYVRHCESQGWLRTVPPSSTV